jgi:hypothetical protein
VFLLGCMGEVALSCGSQEVAGSTMLTAASLGLGRGIGTDRDSSPYCDQMTVFCEQTEILVTLEQSLQL